MSPVGTPRTSASLQGEMDVEEFVAAVIRAHERIQRNLRQLASDGIWALDGAGTDREVPEAQGYAS